MIGFRIGNRTRKVDERIVQQFKGIPVANVSDCMSRLSGLGPDIRPLHRSGALVGAAVTVRTRPGDNLMVHKALDIAGPGDVLVIDGGGDLRNALIGELMLSVAIKRGIAGVVINGAIRDLGWIRSRDFPVFAAGATHRGPHKNGPGELNLPISIDGSVINPGDLILGDDDGVVAIGPDDAEEVLAAAARKHEAETRQLAAIEAGTNDRSWVDEELRRHGVL